MGRAPVLGYPTKTAAMVALAAKGKDAREIAGLVSSTPDAVRVMLRDYRKKHPSGQTRAPTRDGGQLKSQATQPCRLPPDEKRAAAKRLVLTTLAYIAEALDMELAEICATARELIGDAEVFIAFYGDEVLKPAPATPKPSRDQDEAELARLAALEEEPLRRDGAPLQRHAPTKDQREVGQTDTPPLRQAKDEVVPNQPKPRAYRLQSEDGKWLTKDGLTLSYAIAEAWSGSAQQCENIYRRFPKWKILEQVRVP